MKASRDEEWGRGRPCLRLVPADEAIPPIPLYRERRSLGWRIGVGILKVLAALLVGVFFVLVVLTGILSLTSANGRGRMA